VCSAPIGGGAETALAPHQAQPHSIVSDGTSVYWTNFGPGGGIMTAPAAGGAATVLATAPTGSAPAGIAIDDQDVYYADYYLGTINRVPRDGSPPTVLVSGLTAPEPIAVTPRRSISRRTTT
jgi:DNA-binding beta-propeller fold protein YncE